MSGRPRASSLTTPGADRLRRGMKKALAALIGVLALGSAGANASTQTRWRTIVNDQFNKRGLPRHWLRYSNPYGSAPNNCTDPAHDYVSGGYLHIVEKYEDS